jgi:membrane protease YdiL (CAAX protease family)
VKELGKLLWSTVVEIVRDRSTAVLASAVVLLMLWGNAGAVPLLSMVWRGYTGPGSHGNPHRAVIVPGLPFDQEWLSFAIGAVLLFVVPALLIRFAWREKISEYGLGAPANGRLVASSSIALLVVCLPGIWFGAHQPEMRAIYPLFRSFGSTEQFVVYELGYLAFFFASEFIFRGYILFGTAKTHHPHYAIAVALVAHVIWHLGKPPGELASALLWSVAAGAIALATRTIWHLIVVHWLLNVFMDLVIWKGW